MIRSEDPKPTLILFTAGGQEFGLWQDLVVTVVVPPHSNTGLTSAQDGRVNLRGVVMQVYDMQHGLRSRMSEELVDDSFVVARAGQTLLAVRVDEVLGTRTIDRRAALEAAQRKSLWPEGVWQLSDGLVLIDRLDTLVEMETT